MRSLAAPAARGKRQEEEKAKTASGAAGRETKPAAAGTPEAAMKPGLRPKRKRHTLRTVLVVLGALAVVAAALLVPPVSLLDRSLVAMGLGERGTGSGEGAGGGESAGAAQGAGSSRGDEGTRGAEEAGGSAGSGGQTAGPEAGVRIPEADRERIQTLISGSPVEITVLDIYNLVNEVAVSSGFRRLDERPDRRRDPNLIFPGDALALPEKTGHTVAKGDTIWWVSARFIKAQLNRDWRTYQSITGDLDGSGADPAALAQAIEKLAALGKGSYCGKFRKEVDNRIRALRAK
jgi:LysM repeat protein